MPRIARHPKPRPAQGARLLALRKAAGLYQAELARLVGESQGNISFWERTNKPPRSDVLPKLAKVLGVIVLTALPGPAGQVLKAFEEVRKLPRRQQQKVVEFVFAFVNEYKRKAS